MSDFWTELEDENHVWATADDEEMIDYLDIIVIQPGDPIEIPGALHNRLAFYYADRGLTYDDQVFLSWGGKLLVSKDSRN